MKCLVWVYICAHNFVVTAPVAIGFAGFKFGFIYLDTLPGDIIGLSMQDTWDTVCIVSEREKLICYFRYQL